MFKAPSVMLFLTAALILAILASAHAMFDVSGETSARESVSEEALDLSAFPALLSEVVDQDVLERIRDRWGYIYPPSGPAALGNADLREKEKELNRGLEQYAQGEIQRAFRFLDTAYGQYKSKVLGGEPVQDPIPIDEDELVLYGLFRYNRAYGLLETAGQLHENDPKRVESLKLAIYDLRRAVGAFERLGRPGNNREPYWGRRTHAWEGSSLLPEHGNLPIHHAYANLSTAYLRIFDQPGYPYVEPSYLSGEQSKYELGQSHLSPVVSMLTVSCVREGNRANPVKFRLTLALQNLEAAGRGMLGGQEARFNYMIGIILSRLREVDGTVNADDAISFLELAANPSRKVTDPAPIYAARKELAIIYFELGQDRRFLDALGSVEPGPLRDAIVGPNRDYGLLFTDIAQINALAAGDLETVLNHLEFRRHELETGNAPNAVITLHRGIAEALGQAYFGAMRQRMRQMISSGRLPKVGRLLHQWDRHQGLQQSHLWDAYQRACRQPLGNMMRVQANLWVHEKPGHRPLLGAAPWFFALLLIGYVIYCYAKHRQIARRTFWLGYKEDLGSQ